MKRNNKGTPQGGVISPLLANLYGYPRKAFREVNSYARERMTKHLKRRSQRACKVPEGESYYKHLEEMGLIYL